MTSEVTPEGTIHVVDLRGLPSPEQMQAAQAAIERASEGAITLITELEVVPKFVLPAAAERGLRCRVEPPKDGEWHLTLGPAAGGDARGTDLAKEEGGM